MMRAEGTERGQRISCKGERMRQRTGIRDKRGDGETTDGQNIPRLCRRSKDEWRETND